MNKGANSDVSSLSVGSKCLSSAGGGWTEGTVRTVNADSTFKIEDDKPRLMILPYHYGVTEAEISVSDEQRWPRLFPEIANPEHAFSRQEFLSVAEILGHVDREDQLGAFWIEGCNFLFGTEDDEANSLNLDEAQAYRLIRQAGFSAKGIDAKLHSDPDAPDYFKLYWNQTRMGGRNPSEVARVVTLEDAFAALGIDGDADDYSRSAKAEWLETRNGIVLPDALRSLLTRSNIEAAVLNSHPNTPSLTSLENYDCFVRRGLRQHGLDGDIAVSIMLPHQGSHWWYAVFDRQDADARVYVGPEREPGENEEWKLTAPTIGMFFWDLAQTGLGWFEDTQYEGWKPTIKTDIGLVLRA